ncbi:RICIN domain-containing protein [Dactylosporangium sp. CA-152071]|uniref:RICIN domain-containing protein n=1 Tax=Dactylosporangium sp. CA-152071 TaxID=3239933 RepID=UPI003D8DEEC0
MQLRRWRNVCLAVAIGLITVAVPPLLIPDDKPAPASDASTGAELAMDASSPASAAAPSAARAMDPSSTATGPTSPAAASASASSRATASASATTSAGFLRNGQTGRCLQAASNTPVSTQLCDANNNSQKWQAMYVGKSSDRFDVVKFANVATGQCLAIEKNQQSYLLRSVPCSTEGAPAVTWWRVKGSYAQFEMTWQFLHSYCVGSNPNGDWTLVPCNHDGYQKWTFGL